MHCSFMSITRSHGTTDSCPRPAKPTVSWTEYKRRCLIIETSNQGKLGNLKWIPRNPGGSQNESVGPPYLHGNVEASKNTPFGKNLRSEDHWSGNLANFVPVTSAYCECCIERRQYYRYLVPLRFRTVVPLDPEADSSKESRNGKL
jgi:hypothetical protein